VLRTYQPFYPYEGFQRLKILAPSPDIVKPCSAFRILKFEQELGDKPEGMVEQAKGALRQREVEKALKANDS
jgi:hypothetical protein